jgi:hypothetical protein
MMITAKSIAFLLVLSLCPTLSAGQSFRSFEDFLRRYGEARPELKSQVARSFVDWQQARGGFPIRDSDGNVTFVYIGNGEEKDVRLTGDFRPGSYFNVYWDSVGDRGEGALARPVRS